MEEKIQKEIIDYFNFFEEYYNTAKNSLKDCQKYAISINKLIIRSKNIKEAQLQDSPLVGHKDIQNRLCAKLHEIISEEIQEIRSYLSTLEELFDKLCSKHRVLHEKCNKLDLTICSNFVKGSPYQPSLPKLLQFTSDALTFASQVCMQIETALNILWYKKFETTSFLDNFKILPDWENKIPEIIAYTSFLTYNQI